MASHRIATFAVDGSTKYGAVVDGGIVDLSARFGKDFPTLREVIAAGALTRLAEDAARYQPDHALDAITWLPPIPAPEKIICIGVNYPDRNAEYKDGQDAPKYPSMFMRTPRSFVGHLTPLVRPRASVAARLRGRTGSRDRQGRPAHSRDARRWITSPRSRCAMKAPSATGSGTRNSMSRRARISIPPAASARGSFPTPTKSQIADIRLTTRVNGETRQDDRTSRLIFGFRYLINYISTFTTLVPGDVIVTGTPTGAGARFDPPRYLKPGDVVEVEADNIGVLRNGVIDEAS